MNKELEMLIDLALADGVLTDKEKQVLYKKAQALGVDQDELEMVLDARLHLKQKEKLISVPAEKTVQQVKSSKYGDVKKCPSCGAIAESFSIKCKECGYEYRNTENSQTSLKLTKALENIDKEERRARIIKDFPVPNNKEDLFEILVLATSHLNKPSEYFDENDYTSEETVWYLKSKQVIEKLKLLIPDDKGIKVFEEKIKVFDKKKAISFISIIKRKFNYLFEKFSDLSDEGKALVGAVVVIIVILGAIGIGHLIDTGDSDIKSEDKRLKEVEKEIMQEIKRDNYNNAALLINQLDWTLTVDKPKTFMDDLMKARDKYQDKRDYWSNKKHSLEILIEQNKKQNEPVPILQTKRKWVKKDANANK